LLVQTIRLFSDCDRSRW